MPEVERPRERLLRLGPGALKTDELLAILLRTGSAREDVLAVAQRMLAERGGLRVLTSSDLATLAGMHGLGPAKARRSWRRSSSGGGQPSRPAGRRWR